MTNAAGQELLGLSLREIQPEDDLDLLFQLFAAGRMDLDGVPNLNADAQQQLMRHQFQIENEALRRGYPNAVCCLVLLEGKPIGRLYTDSSAADIHILSITLLPDYRSRGIGTKLLRDILQEAGHAGKQVCLRVMWFNVRARCLYERLGFQIAQDEGVTCEMHWTPS